MILQQIATQITRKTTPYGEIFITETNDGVWLGVLAYFITYAIPIITLAFCLFIIFKFLKIFKKMNDTLKEISETLKRKKT
jgi:hypothetical protein